MANIIPYDGADQALKLELLELQKVKFNKALENLVKGHTPPEDFPNGRIPKRPGRGKGRDGQPIMWDYVPAWWVIEQLNSLFGFNWDFEIINQDIGKNQLWVLGKLTVRGQDGISVSKMQYGSSDIKFYGVDHPTKSGQIMDLADDLKSAAQDSLKKCGTLLGMASDIYGRREMQQLRDSLSESDADKKTASNILARRIDKFKLDIDRDVKPLAKESLGEELDSLDSSQIHKLVGIIDKKYTEVK